MSEPSANPGRVAELDAAWAADLAAWAIPAHILEQADEPPWLHAVESFTVVGEVEDSPSHRLARQVMPDAGSALDVGCGGGRASAALIPPAALVVGVDHQQGMLDAYAQMAAGRGAQCETFLGDWPAVAADVPECDVVVCHHVAFNVPGVGAFLEALDRHARARVVLELPMRHPLARLNPYWERIWGIERPTGPTAHDLLAIAQAMGLPAQMQTWSDPQWGNAPLATDADRIDFIRRKVCLPAARADEVAAVMADLPPAPPVELAAIWWDPTR